MIIHTQSLHVKIDGDDKINDIQMYKLPQNVLL